jgi:aminopeptidase N
MKKKLILLLAILSLVLPACLCSVPVPFTPTPATPTWTPLPLPPTSADPAAGAMGLGDPYYPLLGNGGYDALHYDITLDVDMARDILTGILVLTAQATQDLSSFNLDLSGLTVTGVWVDSVPAEFSRAGTELTIVPAAALTNGSRFTVRVEYAGTPRGVSDPAISVGDGIGWIDLPSGVYTINEPSGSMGWFPSNNYPTDKARYTFRVTVAEPYVVAANGLLTQETDNGDTITYVWEVSNPMSTYLATVNIARFDKRISTGPDGLPIRSYFAPGVSETDIAAFDVLPEMIAFYSDLIAPYPFEAYGVVVMPETMGVAMENQTLSVFGADMCFEDAIAHELAHQWFGDSVTVSNWPDIWLNEGFATYLEWLWVEHAQGPAAFKIYVDEMYQNAQSLAAPGDPPSYGLFDWSVYVRGAWVLHALRLTVGDETFFAILQNYYQNFQYGNARTEDFIFVAQNISGRDLSAFFDGWLYADQIPPKP